MVEPKEYKMTYKENLSEAIEECRFYNAVGALDCMMIKDIAFENDVNVEDLKKHI